MARGSNNLSAGNSDLLLIEDQVSLPFMTLPNRCTIVRLNDGKLVVISPTQNFAEHKEKVDALGQVAAIVEPTMFHHLFTAAAKKLYPEAVLYGTRGHFHKCPHIPWEKELDAATWPWNDELPVFEVAGMPKVQEHVFYFKKEKTLIVTDLCFNLTHATGLAAWLILNAFGTYNRLGGSRLFFSFARDKKALAASLVKIASLDFDRLVMAHGETVGPNQNAKEKLRAALQKRGF